MAKLLARTVRRLPSRWVLAASLVLAGAPAARAAGVAPESATADQRSNAEAQYLKGVEAYKAGRFAEAADLFGRSYDVVASPNSHLMYARALREAGKLDLAYEEFALTQAEAAEAAEHSAKYAGTAQTAELEMQDLLKRVAAVSLEVIGDPSKVTLYVGKREVPRDRWRAIAVSPGSVDVTARLQGGHRIWKSVDARLGAVVRVKIDVAAEALQESALPALPPPPAAEHKHEATSRDTGAPPARQSLKPYAYIAGGVGAAGLVTFIVAGSMSRSTYSDLQGACPGGKCAPAEADKIDTGKTEQTIANVGLVVGLVGIGAGVTLFVLDQKGSSEQAATRRLDVVAGPGSMSVRGRF